MPTSDQTPGSRADLSDETVSAIADRTLPADGSMAAQDPAPRQVRPAGRRVSSEDTLAFYRRIARLYAERAQREGLAPADGHLLASGARVLVERRGQTARATYKVYRRAFSKLLADDPSPEAQAAHQALVDAPPIGAPVRGQASTLRRRALPLDDLDAIANHVGKTRSEYQLPLMGWLYAGRLTGLRPTEWFTASLIPAGTPGYPDEGGPFLFVINHKADEIRAHGPSRVLDLSDLPKDDLDIVASFLETAHMFHDQGQSQQLYESCRKLLQRANKALWPRRTRVYTLYSARHAFAANAKSIFDQATVAAMMGHASTETAGEHYARAVQADGGGPKVAANGERILSGSGDVIRIPRPIEPNVIAVLEREEARAAAKAERAERRAGRRGAPDGL